MVEEEQGGEGQEKGKEKEKMTRNAIIMDGKIYCTLCNKQMLSTTELQELIKKAMLDVIKETKSILKIDREKVDERMKQLNICLHGGYGGVLIGNQKFYVKIPSSSSILKPGEIKVHRDEIPPTELDEMQEKVSQMVLPIVKNARRRGISNDEILNVFKKICRETNAPFTSDELERVIKPIIENSDLI